MSNIVQLTDARFEREVYLSNVAVLVIFGAEWCGPCKVVEPALEVLSEEFEGTLKVARMNVDDYPNVATKMRIRNIPALSLFQNGQLKAIKNGACSLNELRRFITSNL